MLLPPRWHVRSTGERRQPLAFSNVMIWYFALRAFCLKSLFTDTMCYTLIAHEPYARKVTVFVLGIVLPHHLGLPKKDHEEEKYLRRN